jgi:MFS family permease
MRYRHGVLTLLILLFAITYLDRICISVAGPRIQEDLHISPVGWSWVTGMFLLAYGLFEIPSGVLGDRIGARKVLTRIVFWWSAFTSLTGAVSSFWLLLLIRFSFGAGEAGAFPNSSIVVSRWFPVRQRAAISGLILMAAQTGGAIAPLLVVPIQMRYGWRAGFYLFGLIGVCWTIVWYVWFRDSPAEMPGVSAQEMGEVESAVATHHASFPWRAAFRSSSALALLFTALCYVYSFNFFQTWFHTFLVKGRGFSESSLALSSLTFILAALCNMTGGLVSDLLVVRIGRKWGRRIVGVVCLSAASILTVAVMFATRQWLVIALLSLVYGCISFQQSGVFGVCLDVGRKHAGAFVGIMNTASQAGGLLFTLSYGYIVERFGYDAPFVPMAILLFIGAILWLRVDASQELTAELDESTAAATA